MPRYVDGPKSCMPPQPAAVRKRSENGSRTRFTVPGWLPYLLIVLTILVGLLQVWFAHERREIAYELRRLDDEMGRIRNEIDAVHIEAERLRSPARAAKLAEELGFISPEEPPTVLPPRPALAVTPIDAPEATATEKASKTPALLSAGPFSWFKRPSATNETDSE